MSEIRAIANPDYNVDFRGPAPWNMGNIEITANHPKSVGNVLFGSAGFKGKEGAFASHSTGSFVGLTNPTVVVSIYVEQFHSEVKTIFVYFVRNSY